MEYLPNRLTFFNFKIYYKKENYLKVRTYLLTKNFKSKQLSKKLNYIRIGPFKIINKIIKVSYRLNLLLKIR